MTGQELYDALHDALENGKIDAPSVYWEEISLAEKAEWNRIAEGAGNEQE